ncbi:DC1 - like 10 [Theobroma cacao]|nr:DC1 - like 10 [Theobroma cacao]
MHAPTADSTSGGEEEEAAYCFLCEDRVEGPSYCCNDCQFYLHNTCAKFELHPEINHPFHPKHPLILLPKPPHRVAIHDWKFSETRTFIHKHPLIFIEKHNRNDRGDCIGCKEPLSFPIYSCLDCYFHLHKECAELPLEITHPYHRKHPLTLLADPSTHPGKCSCYLCKLTFKGFVYHCSICKLGIRVADAFPLRMVTVTSHEHPFTLIVITLFILNVFLGISHLASLVAHTDTVIIHTPSLLSKGFGTVLGVVYAVSFAMDRPLNVKNLDATLWSIGNAAGL